ncbi:hypothetical protein D9756_000755 [Leucocoprinus leucothites]|uniref:DUF6533 domain-containing protein n=1 Tax=Leucocoprinus leucothites TaxID=201217 RepID=A0A8H5LNM4_9AGAR|nr:hypothetical protein D9756_000755 [Leucoagaricus leucothites]
MDVSTTAARLVQQLLRAQYFSGAALVAYVYDYFLTLDREIEYVWKSRWSPVKNLFLLNRYFVIVNIIVQQFLLGTVNGRRSLSQCHGLVQAFIFLTAFGTFLSELLLCLRLWVMWDKNKKVLAGILAIFVAITIYYITDAELSFDLSNSDFIPYLEPLHLVDVLLAGPDSPLDHPPKGCALNVQEHRAYITPIILVVADIIKVALSLIPTLRIYTSRSRAIFRNNIMNEVYREGVLFYVYLCIYSVVELLLVIQSADNAVTAVPVFLVIRVVLASRMVLHIRQLYAFEEYCAQTTESTTRSTYM